MKNDFCQDLSLKPKQNCIFRVFRAKTLQTMAEPTPFSEILYRFVDRLESFLLLSLLAGAVLSNYGISYGVSVVTMALAALAAVFFLMAYRPPEQSEPATGEKKDFMELLSQTILPKILWISCSVGVVGLLLRHVQTSTNGYKEILMIQLATVTGATLVVIGLAVVRGASGVRRLAPIYFRAIPLTLATASILMA